MSWLGLICAKWIEKPCANISIERGCRCASIDSRKSLPWPASGVSTITTVASETASGTGTARRPSAHREPADSRRRNGSSCGPPHHHWARPDHVCDPVPGELVDELRHLVGI